MGLNIHGNKNVLVKITFNRDGRSIQNEKFGIISTPRAPRAKRIIIAPTMKYEINTKMEL